MSFILKHIKRFFDIKFIEHWGTGIERIIQSCLKAGLPKPIFEIKAGDFVVTLNKHVLSGDLLDKLNYRQKNAINFLLENDKITNKDYIEINEIGKTTALKDLNILIDLKIIDRKGSGPKIYYILK